MLGTSRASLTRVTTGVLGGTVFISFATATYYRFLPLPDDADKHKNADSRDANHRDSSLKSTTTSGISSASIVPVQNTINNTISSIGDKSSPNREQEPFCSEHVPIFNRDETPFFLAMAQKFTIGLTAVLIRFFMNTYGEYHITDDKHYQHFLNLVLGGSGRKENNQPLITVSNHRSLFDDPGVVSCLLPLWIGIQPKYNRWGICAQEYCFSDALPAAIKGYMSAGQVLPIRRGAGIDQTLFRDFSSLVARGEWCHIFPEGGVWQWNKLGGRGRTSIVESEAEGIQTPKLRWGIGKLIAHSPIRPRVIPFAHIGMDNLLPQDPTTRKTYLKKDIFGGEPLKVHIQFGEEIYFDDLIQEHEMKYGVLWEHQDGHDFISSKHEKELYHKIALRIQNHLENVTKKVVVKQI